MFYTENLFAIEIGKTKNLSKILVYSDSLILDLIKTIMYKFWYNFKPSYSGKTNFLCVDTGSLIVHVKTDDI